MGDAPSREDLRRALTAAGGAHHDYETNALGGERDERWAGWYAGYVLGRAGDFTTPTLLTGWLESAPGGDDWVASAAEHVLRQLAEAG